MAFHIKLKDKKSPAKLMEEMDNFQLDYSALENMTGYGDADAIEEKKMQAGLCISGLRQPERYAKYHRFV